MPQREIVEIKWFDAQTTMGDMTLKEIREELKPVKSLSVGYLLVNNKKYIVLGFLDFGEEVFKHFQVIPKGMIEEIKTIRKANE